MRRKHTHLLPLAGGISAMVQAFGGYRVRFDLEDGSGGGLAGGGSEAGEAASAGDAAPAEPMSIRDAITASLRQQEAAAPDGADQGPDTQPANDGRTRNADGTFAPKAADAGKDGQPAAPADNAPQQAKPAAVAPEALTPAEREVFAKLPPEAQAVVAQQVQQIANERRFYGEMAPAMQAVQAAAQHFRAHPAQVVQAWAQVQDSLTRDPVAAIKGLVQQFGVDLSKLGTPAVQQQEDVYVDPQVAQLQQGLTSVQQWMQDQQRAAQDAQRQREEAEARTVHASVQDFASTKDDAGQPKHPHFEAVRMHMAALLNAGAAKDLADAYDQAVWARPDLRTQMLAAQQAHAEQQAQASKRQQADRARAAAVSVSGAPGGVAPPAGPSDTSIRGLLARGAGLA